MNVTVACSNCGGEIDSRDYAYCEECVEAKCNSRCDRCGKINPNDCESDCLQEEERIGELEEQIDEREEYIDYLRGLLREANIDFLSMAEFKQRGTQKVAPTIKEPIVETTEESSEEELLFGGKEISDD